MFTICLSERHLYASLPQSADARIPCQIVSGGVTSPHRQPQGWQKRGDLLTYVAQYFMIHLGGVTHFF